MGFKDLQEKMNLQVVFKELGVEGAFSGKEYIACCPMPEHEDKNPSFSISTEGKSKGLWRCFSCGSSGNIIHLVQRVLGLERNEAVHKLLEWSGYGDRIVSPTTKEIISLLGDEQEDVEEDIVKIPMPKVSNSIKSVVNYLMEKRRYTENKAGEIAYHFQMKFSTDGYYKDRIIIPIFDSIGSQITFLACDVTGQQPKKVLQPKGSPMGRLLFNNNNVSSDYVWVVEGVWDAIRLWNFGEPAVAVFGSHLTSHQAKLLISKYNDVFLLYDGDDAGRETQNKAYELLSPYLNVRDVKLQYGDPDDLMFAEFRDLLRTIK